MRINEVSPNTLEGSFSKDLIISKLWLIRKLREIRPSFGTIYILGSWYGNLSLLMLDRNLGFDGIINVDTDAAVLRKADGMANRLGLSDRITSMCRDANLLDYRQLDSDGVVINTSCNNIEDAGWFDNIPSGAMVALQSRTQDPGAVNQHASLDDLKAAYPMSNLIYQSELPLRDADSAYQRLMVIGLK